MKVANIGELKNRLSEFLSYVARLVPIRLREPHSTQLGCGRNTVRIKGDLTQPLVSSASTCTDLTTFNPRMASR